MEIKNIIFDWSGVISDDFTPVYQAVRLVFKKLGRKPISKKEFRREFTLPYMDFWKKYIRDLTKEKPDKIFEEVFDQVDEPTIYNGVKRELQNLNSHGKNMIVFSSHPHDKLMKEVSDYGIKYFFQEILGGIHDKTETISEIMKRNRFEPEQTMYIGDMTHDIEAGKKAGVVTVALGWGYQSEEVLKSSNPDRYISDISELDKLLK